MDGLHQSVRWIAHLNADLMPGYTMSNWAREQQRGEEGAGFTFYLPNVQDDVKMVEAATHRADAVTSLLEKLRSEPTSVECVRRELDRAVRAGDDALLLRCLDVAVRLGMERGTVLVPDADDADQTIERCRRVVAERTLDLTLSGAGDVARWLDGREAWADAAAGDMATYMSASNQRRLLQTRDWRIV